MPKYQGSLQELQHPLWAILKHQPSRTTLSEAFLQRLKPDVQAVLFEPVGGIEVYWQRARVTVVLMRKLERIASLDALAALTWLLREAIAQGGHKSAEAPGKQHLYSAVNHGYRVAKQGAGRAAAQAICTTHFAAGFAIPSAVLHERKGHA